MIRISVLLVLLAGPALAQDAVLPDLCDELWFQRNQIYANAGMCFETPLGKAIFDSTGCSPDDVVLSRFHQALVDQYRQEEARNGCAVDTHVVRPLAVRDLEARRDAPWLGGEVSPSTCIGWTGEPFVLRAEPVAGAPIVADITGGENLSVIVTTQAGGATWSYFYVTVGQDLLAEGWAERDLDLGQCASNAG